MPNNILITPGSASIQFSGSAANTIRLQVESSGSVAFYGNSGSLFSIVDQLSGSLMSVNDVSGLPILEVFSDDRVVMGTLNQNTLVVTGSRVGVRKGAPTADVDVSGSVFITGSLRMNSGGITGSLFGTSSWATNAISSSFATTASAATSITFVPATASFATTASYARNGTKTLTMFTPLDNNPPATAFATLDTVNSIAVLDFDAATDESAVFVKFIPENTNLSSGIRTDLRWMATSATGGNAIWGVQFEKVSGSALTDSFDTITIATGSTAATSGSVNITTITATTINGLGAGDLFKLRVVRSGSAAADTMTGDAELIAVELRAV
jgi:hypothetical protein